MNSRVKKILAVSVLLGVCSVPGFSLDNPETEGSITVTYTGCSGFLIESPTGKVLIDSVFTASGIRGFLSPSAETLAAIRDSQPPFDGIDVLLVGHAHEDHFDPETTDRCLVQNPQAQLVCLPEVADKLKQMTGSRWESYKDRIVVLVLADNETQTLNVRGMEVSATKFPAFSYHPNGLLAFNLEVGTIRLLHLVGAMFEPSFYAPDTFNRRDTDLLLVGGTYVQNSTQLLETGLHYRFALVHHVYNYERVKATLLEKCLRLNGQERSVVLLTEPLEGYQVSKTGGSVSWKAVRFR